MKRYLYFGIIFLTLHCALGQDLIVTTTGDSISCKITRITSEFIHFSVIDKSGILLMRSRLPLAKVANYQQADIDESPQNIPERKEVPIVVDEFDPATFRLSLTTGYTYQLGGYEGLPQSYKKQVQSLWNFGGELDYFLSENIGVGAKVNRASTTANEDFIPPFSNAFGFSSLRDERISFTFIGATVLYRNYLYDDQAMLYFISGGIIKYRTDALADGVPFYQEGDTFGLIIGLNYDYTFFKNFGLGVGLEVNIARLSEFDNNGTIAPADFSLTRVDLIVGIRLFQ